MKPSSVHHENKRATQKALIALGANLPREGADPAETVARALDDLVQDPEISVAAVSQWYRTPAFPPGAGPDFVNGVAVLETGLAPDPLLARLHDVEAALGRTRRVRWAPRVCDLDLLAIGDLVAPDRDTVAAWMALGDAEAQARVPDGLVLPHPRLHRRGFVLVPLLDVAPDWVHPILGEDARTLAARLPAEARAEVRPLVPASGGDAG